MMRSAAPPLPAALRLRIDTDALVANWCVLGQMSLPARAGAAVKADAYGLGVDHVVPPLRDAGCRDWFVAHWQEVAAVARHVPPAEIAVLHGPLDQAEAEYAQASGAVPVINSMAQAKLWLESGGGPCHLMVDTGMNRLGLPMSQIGEDIVGQLEVQVLMSHFASADEDGPLTQKQRVCFQDAVATIPHRETSLANGAGIALGGRFDCDLTRPGLALYGGVPRGELEGRIRQTAFPQARLMQLRDLAAGESVGYNATFVTPEAMRIGTVAIGYADGFLRAWGGKWQLAHHGRQLPIIGRVSMDMIAIDCSEAQDIAEGDWLDIPYHLPTASAASGLSQYELLTLLGPRFDRMT